MPVSLLQIGGHTSLPGGAQSLTPSTTNFFSRRR
uniref:Uncharacterized protein n=1 Tax=Siphoviridae sp. ctDsE1 TaxID=2825390 RepID=A0A8S5TYH2_9CAUD|nr:MAG TPA: hypothetical protein [Siphoviridae sp. ctDsE1]